MLNLSPEMTKLLNKINKELDMNITEDEIKLYDGYLTIPLLHFDNKENVYQFNLVINTNLKENVTFDIKLDPNINLDPSNKNKEMRLIMPITLFIINDGTTNALIDILKKFATNTNIEFIIENLSKLKPNTPFFRVSQNNVVMNINQFPTSILL